MRKGTLTPVMQWGEAELKQAGGYLLRAQELGGARRVRAQESPAVKDQAYQNVRPCWFG
jgi:hypothetical protein